jgi:tight adherence protein B
MRRRTGIEELSYLETAVALNQQTGADLGFLLDRISNSLRARLEAEAELRALTTQTRFGGRVLTWVPVGLMAAMYLMDRDYGPTMLGTLAGNLVLALSGALLMAGRMWFKRITEGI